jgi:hypothetical protein
MALRSNSVELSCCLTVFLNYEDSVLACFGFIKKKSAAAVAYALTILLVLSIFSPKLKGGAREPKSQAPKLNGAVQGHNKNQKIKLKPEIP